MIFIIHIFIFNNYIDYLLYFKTHDNKWYKLFIIRNNDQLYQNQDETGFEINNLGQVI